MKTRLQWASILVLACVLLVAFAGSLAAGQVPASVANAEGREMMPAAAGQEITSPAYTGCGGEKAPVVNASYEQEIVDLVNTTRAGEGLPPLKRATDLDDSARYFATDMGQDDYFVDHDTRDRKDGQLVRVCGPWERIGIYYANWLWLAENVAQGYATPQAVMDAWMASPDHRPNILSTDTWEIGVGYYAENGAFPQYWVQNFGRRAGVYPVIVNGDAATTDSNVVSLYIYGEWQEMRLRNDDGTWTDWLPFRSELSWKLNSGAGQRTVWVELRSGAQTAQAHDTIYLATHAVYMPLVQGNHPPLQNLVR